MSYFFFFFFLTEKGLKLSHMYKQKTKKYHFFFFMLTSVFAQKVLQVKPLPFCKKIQQTTNSYFS